MATARYPTNDLRRVVGSPKSSKGSGIENKDTPCRNIRIYGRCRYEDSGCTFNHDMDKNSSHNEFASKKPLNVESPPFTPSNQALQQQQQPQTQHAPPKKSVLSQAASAAIFTPRAANSATPSLQPTPEQTKFNVATSREFKPQNYESPGNGVVPDPFQDAFAMNSMGPALPPVVNYNPYANEQAGLAGPSAGFYNPHANYSSPSVHVPQYHLYQPIGAYRGELQPWQRVTYDFFIPEEIRRDMQMKAWATQQSMQGLPQLERYHSLVPLDSSSRKSTTSFGYNSWLYKAQSIRNGRYYALRRLEGYRLTNENAILAGIREWKRIKCASIVTLHEAFTTREFQDSSLVFAYDYHPLAKTLLEYHFPPSSPGQRPFRASNHVQEPILWGYICQIANALRAIHSAKLAARCIELNKIIITDKNRIRISSCAILDVVQYDSGHQVPDLQQQDLLNFGRVILALATNNANIQINNVKAIVDGLGTKYTATFKDAVLWLASPSSSGEVKTINDFLSGISSQMALHLDLAMQYTDESVSILAKELENGRIARILMKLNAITERTDVGGNPNWAETGDRFQLRLFRDHVFHQVDADGKPVLAIGHMIACLNKLDASSEETVVMATPDNTTVFVSTFKEMRHMFDRTFNELIKYSKHGAPGAN